MAYSAASISNTIESARPAAGLCMPKNRTLHRKFANSWAQKIRIGAVFPSFGEANTSPAEIPESTYKMHHAMGKTILGGVKDGFFISGYHCESDSP